MAKRVVPEKMTIICDFCQASSSVVPDQFRGEAVLTMEVNSVDHQGSVQARPERSLDLCDICYRRMAKTIDQTVELIKKGMWHG